MLENEIVVAVVDNGIFYDKLTPTQRSYLFVNDAELAENGLDDDGNGQTSGTALRCQEQ